MSNLDKVILNGVEYGISGTDYERTTWVERGDLFDLLSIAEDLTMVKSNYRIYNNSGTYVAQSYANNTIHFFDPSLIPYPRILIRVITRYWSNFCYYDPDNETYTLLRTLEQANAGGLVQLDTIPEGCYLAISSPNNFYKESYYKYLGRAWINPNYVPKFEGLDEPVSSEPIPLELAPYDYSGYPYFYIDLSKYENMLVRLVRNGTMGTATAGFYYGNTLSGTAGATYFSFDNFSPWIYDAKYLIFFFRDNDFVSKTFNITMGWINPEVARMQKQKKYFGIDLAAHNCDTKDLLVHACVWADVIDIDACKTLDDYFVLIHGTTLNGHTIAETNLADMELTYNQMEVSTALEIMRVYGSTCYINFRETPVDKIADLTERVYSKLGRAVVYSGNVTQESSLYGHVSKFYCWKDSSTVDALVDDVGFKVDKLYAGKGDSSENYNYHDWITITAVSTPTSAASIPQDGLYDICFIANNIKNILDG